MATKKKLTQKQIGQEIARAAQEFVHLRDAIWEVTLKNTASRLGMEVEEIEETFGAMT